METGGKFFCHCRHFLFASRTKTSYNMRRQAEFVPTFGAPRVNKKKDTKKWLLQRRPPSRRPPLRRRRARRSAAARRRLRRRLLPRRRRLLRRRQLRRRRPRPRRRRLLRRRPRRRRRLRRRLLRRRRSKIPAQFSKLLELARADRRASSFLNQLQNLSCFRYWEFRRFGDLGKIFKMLNNSKTPNSESNERASMVERFCNCLF